MEFVNYVEKTTGVSIYGLVSLSIFFFFFLIMTVWAFKADKKLLDTLNNIPLNDGEDE